MDSSNLGVYLTHYQVLLHVKLKTERVCPKLAICLQRRVFSRVRILSHEVILNFLCREGFVESGTKVIMVEMKF